VALLLLPSGGWVAPANFLAVNRMTGFGIARLPLLGIFVEILWSRHRTSRCREPASYRCWLAVRRPGGHFCPVQSISFPREPEPDATAASQQPATQDIYAGLPKFFI